jgi:hypothetical protein
MSIQARSISPSAAYFASPTETFRDAIVASAPMSFPSPPQTTTFDTSTSLTRSPKVIKITLSKEPRDLRGCDGFNPTTTFTYTLCPNNDHGFSPWCRYLPGHWEQPTMRDENGDFCSPTVTMKTYFTALPTHRPHHKAPISEAMQKGGPYHGKSASTVTYTPCAESSICEVEAHRPHGLDMPHEPWTTGEILTTHEIWTARDVKATRAIHDHSSPCNAPAAIATKTKFIEGRPDKPKGDRWDHGRFEPWKNFLLRTHVTWGDFKFDNLYLQNPDKRKRSHRN